MGISISKKDKYTTTPKRTVHDSKTKANDTEIVQCAKQISINKEMRDDSQRELTGKDSRTGTLHQVFRWQAPRAGAGEDNRGVTIVAKRSKKQEITIRSSAAEYLTFVAASGEGGVETIYADENVWLSQKMMATLYNVDVRTINEHLKKIFSDNEVNETQLSGNSG
jgi:hypothetical protein